MYYEQPMQDLLEQLRDVSAANPDHLADLARIYRLASIASAPPYDGSEYSNALEDLKTNAHRTLEFDRAAYAIHRLKWYQPVSVATIVGLAITLFLFFMAIMGLYASSLKAVPMVAIAAGSALLYLGERAEAHAHQAALNYFSAAHYLRFKRNGNAPSIAS